MLKNNVILHKKQGLNQIDGKAFVDDVESEWNRLGIFDNPCEIKEKQYLDFLYYLKGMNRFLESHFEIYYVDSYSLFPSYKSYKHYFLVSFSGYIFDLLAWNLQVPIDYDSKKKYIETNRKNPIGNICVSLTQDAPYLLKKSMVDFVLRMYEDIMQSNSSNVDYIIFVVADRYKCLGKSRKAMLLDIYEQSLLQLRLDGYVKKKSLDLTNVGRKMNLDLQDAILIESRGYNDDVSIDYVNYVFDTILKGNKE